MWRIFSVFSFIYVLDIHSKSKFSFALVRPGFVVSLSIIWFIRYPALQQLVVESMGALSGHH